jgi:hypothetical protein
VQTYQNSDGSTRRELRLEQDVRASVPGFAQKPLTNGHPPGLVDPDNAKHYAVGAVGGASYSDGWVRAPLTVWQRDAIDAIRDGRAQLSVGYSCRLVDESGVHDGQAYDCRQEDIVINHLAIVDVARAGPEARLRLDAGDAVAMTDQLEQGADMNTKNGSDAKRRMDEDYTRQYFKNRSTEDRVDAQALTAKQRSDAAYDGQYFKNRPQGEVRK